MTPGSSEASSRTAEAEEQDNENSEEKRKSTGSISSLVKMWEGNPSTDPQQQHQVTEVPAQPATASSSNITGGLAVSHPQPPANQVTTNSGSVVKFEKRIWPPIPYSTDNPTEKPVVPIKPLTVQNSGIPSTTSGKKVMAPPTTKPPPPTTKPPPPIMGVKPPLPGGKPSVCNIYAAPSQISAHSSTKEPKKKSATSPAVKESHKKSGQSVEDTETSTDSGLSSLSSSCAAAPPTTNSCVAAVTSPPDDRLLQSIQELANNLHSFGHSKENNKAASQKILCICTGCTGVIDSISPTARFKFRGLVNKLENLSKDVLTSHTLKSDGQAKIVGEIKTVLKDLLNILQR